MPVVIDEVNAEITPDSRGEQHAPQREAQPHQDIAEQVLRTMEREHYRLHRLSDR